MLPWLRVHAEHIDGVLLDVDGVLMVSRRALPGARDLVGWLSQHGPPFVLLTNDGCNSPAEKVGELRDSGFDFSTDQLVSSGHALEEFAVQEGHCGELFFMMGVLGSPCYAEAAGLRVTSDASRLSECRGILVGEKHYDWEPVVAAVWNFLIKNPDAPVVVANPDVYFRVRGNDVHPASGAMAGFLEWLCSHYGTPIRPTFLGKPYRPIFEHAHRVLEQKSGTCIECHRLLMVGDSLHSDIRGGSEYGCQTALLMTGVTTPAQLRAAEVRPNVVCDAIV